MQVQRVAAVLQCAAEMRNWMALHVPGAGTMPGHDLFLVLADKFLHAQPLRLDTLAAALPYPMPVIEQGLLTLSQGGLLLDYVAGAPLRLSERFVELLGQYQCAFENVMIPRHMLRAEQFLVHSEHLPLRQFATSLYDHFYDLGWLYLHCYGATCFMMATLVQRVAQARGHRARIAVCYAEVVSGDEMFLLGAKGYASAGRLDGHPVCIVDETLLVDFGLGNVRRAYRRDFHWGLACDYRPQAQLNLLAQMCLPNGTQLRWRDDWQSPEGEAQLAGAAPLAEQLFREYERRYA